MANFILGIVLVVMLVFSIGAAFLASEEKELRRQRRDFDDQ